MSFSSNIIDHDRWIQFKRKQRLEAEKMSGATNSYEMLARDAKAKKLASVLLKEFANQLEKPANVGTWKTAAIAAGVNPPGEDGKTRRMVCHMIREFAGVCQREEKESNG